KHLGQNFLKDKNILRKEANLLKPKGKTVLEIGPGDGRLTEQLILTGAKKIFIVEKDPRMVELLRQKFAGLPVEIIETDFLELNPFKINSIIGNIPYYISSPILFKLKDFDFQLAILMVQDEFAKKLLTPPNTSKYGHLSAFSKIFYEINYIQKVPAHLFTPKPKVDSAIISIRKRPNKYPKSLETILRVLFQHKNKTLRNTLLSAGFKKPFPYELENFLKSRPRALYPEEIIKISKILEKINKK
ncbi:ribosomal RNA small subunit methyltransferase A, partial [Candidatus Micrarchaeota archaeon]|nr:ribosomal RNA small subunit methyltransferase A [Candidatus Micrarchaeota archaeon]